MVAYSDGRSTTRDSAGFLDDYAYTAIACLDAYEATSDITYFRTAQKVTDQMIERFYDSGSGGFFDSQSPKQELGVLAAKRKPFQDSPMPAGNPVAASALTRLHAYTNESSYREKAEKTLELLAGVAARYGIFAASYGLAAAAISVPHIQIVIVGEDQVATELCTRALAARQIGKSVLKFTFSQTVESNLPPSLAVTIPNLPAVKQKRTSAIVCSGTACQPSVHTVEELDQLLREENPAA